MKARRWIYLGLALGAAFLLAFPLRSMVADHILLPVARFFWIAQGYYGAIPQMIFWIVALVVAAVLALSALQFPDLGGLNFNRRQTRRRGPVEELAFWLQRRKTGDYPRWYVARILADLATDLVGGVVQEKHLRRLIGESWNPPPKVQGYLEAGLHSNYPDFQRRTRLDSTPPVDLDQDLDPVIDYLEAYLESENDQHS